MQEQSLTAQSDTHFDDRTQDIIDKAQEVIDAQAELISSLEAVIASFQEELEQTRKTLAAGERVVIAGLKKIKEDFLRQALSHQHEFQMVVDLDEADLHNHYCTAFEIAAEHIELELQQVEEYLNKRRGEPNQTN